MFNTDFDWLGAYSKQIHDVLTSAHNHGYAEGFDRAKREYGESRGVAHCHRATQEEVDLYPAQLKIKFEVDDGKRPPEGEVDGK